MDTEKQAFDIFGSFLKDLSKTFPEIKNCLYRNYEYELVGENKQLDKSQKLQNFLKLIQENDKLITEKDVSFFQQDNLLEEICFQKLWEKNISNKTREIIWKYLQTFSIINISLNSSHQLKQALETMGSSSELKKEDIKDKKTAKDLKKLKKLTENVTGNVAGEEKEFDELLGGVMDSDIGKIAKEVANEIDVEKIFGDLQNADPSTIMQQMMNPEKIGSIFQNINQVIEKKVEKGELNKEGLQNEAENLQKQMSSNPLFNTMMGQMNHEKPELSEKEKREKLKQKIKEKKNQRIK